MFKSKHSGWTWDLKRTPFGPNNPISAITDPISSALGTDGSGGGALGTLASIDPGPAIGSGLAQVDQAVNNTIPGGWITVGGLAAGGLAIAYAPEVMAYAAQMGIEPAAASAELGVPGVNAATGEAVSSGTGLTGGAGGSTGLLAGGTTSGLTIPGGAAIAVDPAIAAGTGAGIGSAGAAGLGTVGGLSAGLPAAGSVGGAGAGMSAGLAPGTVMGTGAAGGGAIGSTYAAGANGLPATDFFGNYIPASSINTGGVPNTVTGTSITSDTLNTLNNVKKGTDAANKLSQLLNQGAASGLSSSLGKLAAGQNASPEVLPNLVRGNQNPFSYTAQQPIQNAQPMDLSALSKLLKQG